MQSEVRAPLETESRATRGLKTITADATTIKHEARSNFAQLFRNNLPPRNVSVALHSVTKGQRVRSSEVATKQPGDDFTL